MKDNIKGITLVALVITIVILLILAGITIGTLTGDNGLFNRAKEAKEKSTISTVEEELNILLSEYLIGKTTENKDLKEFLDEKVKLGEIDGYQVIDNTIEIQKGGYILVVDKDGNKLEEIQKDVSRIKISNKKITSEDGTTEVENNSQVPGNKLKISFDVSINNGEIIQVEPADKLENGNATYVTDGIEKEIQFVITGKIGENYYTKQVKISVEDKYTNVLYDNGKEYLTFTGGTDKYSWVSYEKKTNGLYLSINNKTTTSYTGSTWFTSGSFNTSGYNKIVIDFEQLYCTNSGMPYTCRLYSGSNSSVLYRDWFSGTFSGSETHQLEIDVSSINESVKLQIIICSAPWEYVDKSNWSVANKYTGTARGYVKSVCLY